MIEPIYRIVVGTDFTDTANLALRRAFDLASRETHAEVHVVNAVREAGKEVHIELPDHPPRTMPLADAQEGMEAYTVAELQLWQKTSGRNFSCLITHLSTESPTVAILQLATDLDAELIVVGTHGRQGLRQLILGSVAEAVVRMAHVPVLVIRPKDHQAHVPEIQPPCAKCVEERFASGGKAFWCAQHRESHARRHTYHYKNRSSQDGNIGSI